MLFFVLQHNQKQPWQLSINLCMIPRQSPTLWVVEVSISLSVPTFFLFFLYNKQQSKWASSVVVRSQALYHPSNFSQKMIPIAIEMGLHYYCILSLLSALKMTEGNDENNLTNEPFNLSGKQLKVVIAQVL